MEGLRRVLLQQAVNVRDLGGYPCAGGGATPSGHFFRADNMHGLSQEDLKKLYDLGIRTILDLRTPGECTGQPNSFAGYRDVQVLNCSLLGESTDQFTGFLRSLGENYAGMIRQNPERYAQLFTMIAQRAGAGGILFHCTAGKDRTGVTAALLLGLAGVPEEDIVADYALTDVYLRPKVRVFMEHNPTANPDLFRAQPENMQHFVETLRQDFGDARGYLLQAGVAEELLERIWG